MTELVEIIDGLPNISGSEMLIEQVIRDSRPQPVFLPASEIDFSKIQSAAAIALHMHQPLIPAGGENLKSAAVISNLQTMFDQPTLGDNHHAPVFHWCYKRINQFISQLVDDGQQPRIMLDYSGALLYGLRQMGFDDVFDNLKRLAVEPRYRQVVEWLGSTWGHALAPSTPVQDFRLHVRAWQHHFAAIFGLEALGRVRGFSLAELALPNHPDVAYDLVKTLQECGYQWLLVQEDTVETPETGQKPAQPHLPHVLKCTNTKGDTATIIAIIKTQGSDPRLVAQMQGYYAAKTLERESLAKQSIPPLVTHIADGENSIEMMNEFPRRYFGAVREATGSTTPLLNVTEYLEHLLAAGLSPDDFPVVQPAGQKQLWEGFEPGDRPAKLQRLIQRLNKKDERFRMEDGCWTDKSAWLKKQGDSLDPLAQASALFYQTVLKRRVPSDDPRYRRALFHLLAAQSSAFYHLHDGDWAGFRNELLRRTTETLTKEFKPRQTRKKATQPSPKPPESAPASAIAPGSKPQAPQVTSASTRATEAMPDTAKPAAGRPTESEAKPKPAEAAPAGPAAPEAKQVVVKPAALETKDPVTAPVKVETPPPTQGEPTAPAASPLEPGEKKTPQSAPIPPTLDQAATPNSQQTTAAPAPVEEKSTAVKPKAATTAPDKLAPAASKKTPADPKPKPASPSRKRKSR